MPNQKRIITLFIVLMICFNSLTYLAPSKQVTGSAQTLTALRPAFLQEWNVTFGLSYYNKACEIIQTNDGAYAVIGSCGPKGNPPHVVLIKIDAKGHLLWNQTYDLKFINYPMNTVLAQTEDGGFIIVGNTNAGMALIKTDLEGKVEWRKTYSIYNDIAQGLIQTSDGGFLIVAESAYNGKTNPSALIIKTNPWGEIQWRKDCGAGAKYFRAIVEADNGSYVAAGTTFTIATQQFSAWLLKIDNSSNILWSKKIPAAPANDTNYKYYHTDIFTMIKTNDNGYALAGRTVSENTNGNTTLTGILIKTDSNGSVQWNKSYTETGQNPIYSIVQTHDGCYALTGTVDNNMILIKTDTKGNTEYNQTFGNNSSDAIAVSAIETDDGGFAVAGYTLVDERYFIIKTSPAPLTAPSTDSSPNLTSPKLLEAVATIAGLLVIVVGIIIIVIKKPSKRTPVPAQEHYVL